MELPLELNNRNKKNPVWEKSPGNGFKIEAFFLPPKMKVIDQLYVSNYLFFETKCVFLAAVLISGASAITRLMAAYENTGNITNIGTKNVNFSVFN